MSTHRPPGRRIRDPDLRRPLSRAGRRRRVARRRGLLRILVAAGIVGTLVAAAVMLIPSKAGVGRAAPLDVPAAPSVSETAGMMLRVSWRPVRFADHYEVVVSQGGEKQRLRVEATEVQVPHLTPQTGYAVSVRAVDEKKGKDARSKASRPALTRTEPPDRPELLVPTNAIVGKARNTSLDVAWETVDTATGYAVQLDTDESFDDPRTMRGDARTATFKGLDAVQPYFVRVRAEGADDMRSAWSPVIRTETTQPDDPQPLAVASFNIRCHSCGGPSWTSRRGAVAATIATHDLDVIGLQEAQQSMPRGLAVSQFQDLLRQLALQQDGWKIADGRIDGSLGTRVIYNTKAVRLVKAGAVPYRRQRTGDRYHQRYFSWAILTQRSSGRNFLFVSTHLEPSSLPVRIAQAGQLAADTRRLRGSMPSIVVGDFNASQYHAYSIHRAVTDAGYVDPLGILPSSSQVSKEATAERRINTQLDSYNDFSSRPSGRSRNSSLNGTYIDYIFTTPMRVLEYENVVDVDASGRFRSGPPSDHDMLRAVVGLP